MAVSVYVGIINTAWVEGVDAHRPAGVQDSVVVEHNAHMGNSTLFVVKKSEVAFERLLEKVDQTALAGLLAGVAKQADAGHSEGNLGESAAVDAKGTAPAPEVGTV